MPFWAQGIGETSGDALITEGSFQTTGTVWYVHHTGDNANDGEDRARPVATLAQAVSNAYGGDTIVCLDGHTETLGTAVEVNKEGIMIVGAGTSGGIPTVTFTPNNADGLGAIDASQPGVRLRNLKFKARTADGSSPVVQFNKSGADPAGGEVKDCYFECGEHNTGSVLNIGQGAHYLLIRGTTFICTAAAAATQPIRAIGFGAYTLYGLRMEDVTFDGGVDGYSGFWAYDSNAGTGQQSFLYERVVALRGADMRMKSTDTGTLQVVTAQGGARVDWT